MATDAIFGPRIAVPLAPEAAATSAPKPPNWIDQPHADADRKSAGCIECHTGIEDMHASPNVVLGCTDCHGGNPTPGLYDAQGAPVAPRNPIFWEKPPQIPPTPRCC